MKELIRSSVVVTGIRGAGIVLQSLILLFLARSLPVHELGIFALFYAGFGIVRILGPLGTDQVTMRQVAVAEGIPDGALHRILNTSFVLVAGVNAVIAAAAFGLVSLAFPWVFEATGLSVAELLLIIASAPAFALIGLMTYQLRGFGYNALAQFPDSVALQLFIGGGVAGLAYAGRLDLPSTLFVLVAAAWLVAAIYLVIRLRIGVDTGARPTWMSTRCLIGESREVLYALSITALSARLPLLLSAPLLGSAATAIFDVASRFGSVPSITTSAVAVAFSPRFAALAHSSDRAAMSRTLSFASLVAVSPAIAYFGVAAAAAPFLIDHVLPPAYAHIYLPMLVVCAALTVNAAFGVTSNFLFMAGESRVVRNFSIAQLAGIGILTPLFAWQFGTLGLAVAVLAGSVIRDVGMAVWASRRFGVTLPPFGLGRLSRPRIQETGGLVQDGP
ncbi:MAG: lipopolysaccharide biosynthesis protein [Bauldia sp.]|uniref:lipopolysaccharide biosynthesis protein n=1 Tax=Bauldia sp. TaxID=2575872 RepID=UPI001D382B11|nr:hypothetical protein [Bauldia sp.]MCB1494708.1 lipopolysaccharide biosynthesis protein [Bauldia sp.]